MTELERERESSLDGIGRGRQKEVSNSWSGTEGASKGGRGSSGDGIGERGSPLDRISKGRRKGVLHSRKGGGRRRGRFGRRAGGDMDGRLSRIR